MSYSVFRADVVPVASRSGEPHYQDEATLNWKRSSCMALGKLRYYCKIGITLIKSLLNHIGRVAPHHYWILWAHEHIDSAYVPIVRIVQVSRPTMAPREHGMGMRYCSWYKTMAVILSDVS